MSDLYTPKPGSHDSPTLAGPVHVSVPHIGYTPSRLHTNSATHRISVLLRALLLHQCFNSEFTHMCRPAKSLTLLPAPAGLPGLLKNASDCLRRLQYTQTQTQALSRTCGTLVSWVWECLSRTALVLCEQGSVCVCVCMCVCVCVCACLCVSVGVYAAAAHLCSINCTRYQ